MAKHPGPLRRPGLRTSIIVHRCPAPVLDTFLGDRVEVPVEYDAIFAGERDEAPAAGAADRRQPRLARKSPKELRARTDSISLDRIFRQTVVARSAERV
jgi:hypothetical protein